MTDDLGAIPSTGNRVQAIIVLRFRNEIEELWTRRRWVAAAGSSSLDVLAISALERIVKQTTDCLDDETKTAGARTVTSVHTEIKMIYTDATGAVQLHDIVWHTSENSASSERGVNNANAKDLASNSLSMAERETRNAINSRFGCAH